MQKHHETKQKEIKLVEIVSKITTPVAKINTVVTTNFNKLTNYAVPFPPKTGSFSVTPDRKRGGKIEKVGQ